MSVRIYKSMPGLPIMVYGSPTNERKLQRQIATGGGQAWNAKWHRSQFCTIPWNVTPTKHMATVRVREFRMNDRPYHYETDVMMDIDGKMEVVGSLCRNCATAHGLARRIDIDDEQQWLHEIVGEERRG